MMPSQCKIQEQKTIIHHAAECSGRRLTGRLLCRQTQLDRRVGTCLDSHYINNTSTYPAKIATNLCQISAYTQHASCAAQSSHATRYNNCYCTTSRVKVIQSPRQGALNAIRFDNRVMHDNSPRARTIALQASAHHCHVALLNQT